MYSYIYIYIHTYIHIWSILTLSNQQGPTSRAVPEMCSQQTHPLWSKRRCKSRWPSPSVGTGCWSGVAWENHHGFHDGPWWGWKSSPNYDDNQGFQTGPIMNKNQMPTSSKKGGFSKEQAFFSVISIDLHMMNTAELYQISGLCLDQIISCHLLSMSTGVNPVAAHDCQSPIQQVIKYVVQTESVYTSALCILLKMLHVTYICIYIYIYIYIIYIYIYIYMVI